jgi:hypothetical protein
MPHVVESQIRRSHVDRVVEDNWKVAAGSRISIAAGPPGVGMDEVDPQRIRTLPRDPTIFVEALRISADFERTLFGDGAGPDRGGPALRRLAPSRQLLRVPARASSPGSPERTVIRARFARAARAGSSVDSTNA